MLLYTLFPDEPAPMCMDPSELDELARMLSYTLLLLVPCRYMFDR